MEHKIIRHEKNPFLSRDEYTIEIVSDTNPSFEDAKKIVNKDMKLSVVKKIINNFGRKLFTAEVFVYDSKKDMDRIETIPKKVKKKMQEEAKAKKDAEKKAEVGEEKVEGKVGEKKEKKEEPAEENKNGA